MADYSDALPVGARLQNGGFTVGQVLGQGGFGITYTGSDVALRRAVAIKEFFPQGSSRRGSLVVPPANASDYHAARDTFLEEARVLARFAHPNIVDVYTVFEENDAAYMVMELLRGRTLQQLVEERGVLPESEALNYVAGVASALEAVHGAGLLHQDVKPDNIMLCDPAPGSGPLTASSSGARIVLLDFGLSKKLESAQGLGTVRFSGDTRFGTAGYAPLEQYGRQAQVGTYSDVYALAATLYFLLTKQIPVEATDRASGVELPDVRAINPSVSETVALALNSALSMSPQDRPQTPRAFLELLTASSPSLSTHARADNSNASFDDRNAQDADAPFASASGQANPPLNVIRVSLPDVDALPEIESLPDLTATPNYAPPGFEHRGPVFDERPIQNAPLARPQNQPQQDEPEFPSPFGFPFPPQGRQRQGPRVVFRSFGCCPMGCFGLILFLFFLMNIFGSIFTSGGGAIFIR